MVFTILSWILCGICLLGFLGFAFIVSRWTLDESSDVPQAIAGFFFGALVVLLSNSIWRFTGLSNWVRFLLQLLVAVMVAASFFAVVLLARAIIRNVRIRRAGL